MTWGEIRSRALTCALPPLPWARFFRGTGIHDSHVAALAAVPGGLRSFVVRHEVTHIGWPSRTVQALVPNPSLDSFRSVPVRFCASVSMAPPINSWVRPVASNSITLSFEPG